MIAYFLPLEAGAVKKWGTPTDDFWCCHGTLVQAQTLYARGAYYEDTEGLVLCQYIPTEVSWTWQGAQVRLVQRFDPQTGAVRRPDNLIVNITVEVDQPIEFALKLRIPWWTYETPTIEINGVREPAGGGPSSFYAIKRAWQHDTLRIVLPKALQMCPLPDRPETVAFMDGPVVLAGLAGEERLLRGDKTRPSTILVPDNEREWGDWIARYHALGQDRGLRFIPLYEVRDERYTVYFPVREP